jgi:phosphotransferase system HPr-like phosphotransfer protein
MGWQIKMGKTSYKIKKEQHKGVSWYAARDVPVELVAGIVLKPAYRFVEECSQHRNGILFYDGFKMANAKDMMELLSLSALRGNKVSVFVQDSVGTNGEDVLKRLCSGLTTKAFEPDFGGRR